MLKRTASVLKKLTNGLGEIARIGGEEFHDLLNRMEEKDRNTVAQHFRLSIGMINHPELPDDGSVTASLGLAPFSGDGSLSKTMRKADQCLYKAKAEGRNRVIIAPEQPDSPAVQSADANP